MNKTTENTSSVAPIVESILPEYIEYSRLDQEIARLTALRDAAKAKIRTWQESTGAKNAEGSGFQSVVVDGYTRETLLRDKIEALLGRAIPTDCIKATVVKPSFKISGKLLVEG